MTAPSAETREVDPLAEIRERLANIPPDQWFWDHFTAEDMWLVIELLDSVDAQYDGEVRP
jgi:hypothetical protein